MKKSVRTNDKYSTSAKDDVENEQSFKRRISPEDLQRPKANKSNSLFLETVSKEEKNLPKI